MAIDAKVSFLNSAEKRMAKELTADSMTRVLAILADIMDGFDMREIVVTEYGNDDLLKCYINALKVQGRSEKTLERYRYIISRMVSAVGVPTRKITVYHLRSYFAQRKESGTQDSTLEGERAVFSAYFNWLQRESLIEKNPTSNLGTIKCAKKKKRTISDVDMIRLDESCKTIRDRAIIAFLASTGCRISEMTSLNKDSIQYNADGAECIVHGKGNKERKVYIDSVAAMLLKRYLAERKDFHPALFIGKQHRRLQPGGVRQMLKELAKSAGVAHVHPHMFRRTLATNMSRHGMPIQEVAHLLGHEKLDTTMRYVVQNDTDVRNDYYRQYA